MSPLAAIGAERARKVPTPTVKPPDLPLVAQKSRGWLARRRRATVPRVTDCVFCGLIDRADGPTVVLADDVAVAFLDIRPVFKGHVLVAPRAHVVTLPDLPAADIGPFFRRVQRVSAALPAALGSQGTFVAANNVVSQSVPHLHLHVVPRTKGDGLRGFFWPRQRYESDAEAADYAARIRAALGNGA
jgi:histidine triad (HIT) family protein